MHINAAPLIWGFFRVLTSLHFRLSPETMNSQTPNEKGRGLARAQTQPEKQKAKGKANSKKQKAKSKKTKNVPFGARRVPSDRGHFLCHGRVGARRAPRRGSERARSHREPLGARGYDESCECARISEIVGAIGGKSVVFVRYNPDTVRYGGTVQSVAAAERIDLLVETVKQELKRASTGFEVRLVQLWYDAPVADAKRELDITRLVAI